MTDQNKPEFLIFLMYLAAFMKLVIAFYFLSIIIIFTYSVIDKNKVLPLLSLKQTGNRTIDI